MRTIEERKASLKANRHRYTPERLLEVTEQLNQDQAQRAVLRLRKAIVNNHMV